MIKTELNLLDRFTIKDDENSSENEEPPSLIDSPYIDDDSIVTELKTLSEGIILLSSNIQSMNAKFDQLKIYLSILKDKDIVPTIICLQETWHAETDDLKRYKLDDYHLIPKGHSATTHGGLMTYISKNFQYKQLPIAQRSDIWEQQFFEITHKKYDSKLVLGNIYRPPRELASIVKIFSDEFRGILQNLSYIKGEIALAGDYNHDLFKADSKPHCAEFLDLVVANSFMPRIVRPTRVTRTSDTLIDNIFIRFSPVFVSSISCILTNKLSDHYPILVKIRMFGHSMTKERRKNKYRLIRKETKTALTNLLTELTNLDILNKLDTSDSADANKNYKILTDILTESYNRHCPLRNVKFDKRKHKNSEWITDAIMNSIKQRNKLYKNLKNTEKDDPRYTNLDEQLKNFNKILKRSINLAKKHYYSNLFSKFQNDIKKTWRNINILLNRDKTKDDGQTTLKIDGQQTTDGQTISDSFNTFFSNIGRKVTDDLPTANKTPEDYLTAPIDTTFSFKPVDDGTIERIIREELSSKSSFGEDGFSSKLIKHLKESLVSPLTLICNQSIKSGTFPNLMKIAKVIPLFKKGDAELVDNYRPISLLPALSKVLERVLYEQIFDYFTAHKLFAESQYGFRKNRSTDQAAIELVDKISAVVDNRKQAIAIFMDLSKAFDTLNHSILLMKLKYYGFSEQSLLLMKNYLTQRQQYVSWDNCSSGKENISTGIPQGSILGPLLFIIYVNDLSRACTNFSPICFADDTTLFSSLDAFGRSSGVIQNNINAELKSVREWLLANKLSLNSVKTKYMIFREINTRKRNISVQINDQELERVTTFKFLGLTLHEHRSWANHISEVCLKISRTVGVMNRLKSFIPSSVLLSIYNGLITPYLNSHLLTWGSSPLSRLPVLQRKAVRIITKNHFLAHCDPLFKELNILKLEHMYPYQCLKLYFKCKNNLAPVYFNNFLELRGEATEYLREHPLRNAEDHSIPFMNKTTSQKTVRFNIGKIFDQVSSKSDISSRCSGTSIFTFSNYVKNYFINQYNTSCSIKNCYPCRVSLKLK